MSSARYRVQEIMRGVFRVARVNRKRNPVKALWRFHIHRFEQPFLHHQNLDIAGLVQLFAGVQNSIASAPPLGVFR